MGCSPIVIVDGGCLDKTVIKLPSKGPEEAIFYPFSLANRIGDQTLLEVNAQANSDDVQISKITVDGQTFKCLISGGTLYHNVTIRFTAKTSDGETRTFNAVLPIRPEGVQGDPGNGFIVVAGATGPKGESGNSIASISISQDGFVFTMSDGTVIKAVPEGLFIQDGVIIAPRVIAELPDDFILNGSIYMAPDAYLNGTKQLPDGLSLNANIVMTDGSVFFKNTLNNNGVLCAGLTHT